MSVWYACYGSNLLQARFDVYLRGGVFPGNALLHKGARDATPPSAVRWWSAPGQVKFAGFAPQWGGAVAYLDPCAQARAWLRCYLISDDQFDDVVAQEAGRDVAPGLRELVNSQAPRFELGSGHYETLWHLGELDGVDVVSFTCPHPDELTPAAPSASYLATIAQGLLDGCLDVDAVSAYLLACPGVRPAWDADAIRSVALRP